MKAQQAATLFSFVLSCVYALPSIAAPADFPLARDITQFITKPDRALDQVRGLPPDMKLSLTGTPRLYQNMIVEGERQVRGGYLRDVTPEHSNALLGSIWGYAKELGNMDKGLEAEVKARRLAIYHDSLYSRLVDIQKAFPEDFEKRATLAKRVLESILNIHIMNIHQASIVPMGEKEAVEKWVAEARKLQATRGPEVRQRLLTSSQVLPPAYQLNEFNYLSKAEVLDKLKAAGAEPHPLLVDPSASHFSELPASKETAATGATQAQTASGENKPGKVYVTADHLKQAIDNVNKNNAASSKLPASAAADVESPLKAHTGTPVSVSA